MPRTALRPATSPNESALLRGPTPLIPRPSPLRLERGCSAQAQQTHSTSVTESCPLPVGKPHSEREGLDVDVSDRRGNEALQQTRHWLGLGLAAERQCWADSQVLRAVLTARLGPSR
jgi:hypothetical protein